MDYFGDMLAEIPSAYYRLDEYRGDLAFDFSARSDNNLNRLGNPSYKEPFLCSDWPSGSIKFNQVGDYLDFGRFNSNFFSTNKLTVIALIKPLTIAQSGYILNCGPTSGIDLSYGIKQVNDVLRFSWNTGITLNSVDSPSCLVANQRCWIAFTRSSLNVLKFYLNGSLLSTNTLSANTASQSSIFQVGGDGFTNFFNGWIDELAIFNNVEMPDWKLLNLYNKAIRIWPNSFQSTFAPDAYEETFPDVLESFNPVYGRPLTRPWTTSGYKVVNGTIDVTSLGANTARSMLEDFYFETLESGTLTFEAKLCGESTPSLYYFTKVPSFHDLETGEMEAQLNLIVLP